VARDESSGYSKKCGSDHTSLSDNRSVLTTDHPVVHVNQYKNADLQSLYSNVWNASGHKCFPYGDESNAAFMSMSKT